MVPVAIIPALLTKMSNPLKVSTVLDTVSSMVLGLVMSPEIVVTFEFTNK